MAAKKKTTDKVVDITTTEEETMSNENIETNVQSEADTSTVNDQEVHTEDSKVESDPGKKGKVKNFLKKNWKKIAIGAGCAAVAVGGYVVYKKVFDKSPNWELAFHTNPANSANGILSFKDFNDGSKVLFEVTTLKETELPDWINQEHLIDVIHKFE